MRLLFVLCGALALCGCVSAYDASAEPAAQQAKALGYDQCNAALARKELKTNVAMLECVLASEKKYAVDIKLQNMGFYDAYAARVRLIAIDRDAGRLSNAQMESDLAAAHSDYISAMNQAYVQTAADNAATTNFLVGAAGAFATGYAHPIPP